MKNKRKWIMVALAIMIAIGGVLNVYAEDTEVDEKHETYYIHYVTTRQFDTYSSEWNVGASFTFKEGYVPAFYWYETGSDYRLQLMIYNENSGDIIDTETCDMSVYESKYSTYCSYNSKGIKTYSDGLVESIEIVGVNYMLSGWDGPMYMESSARKKTVATNIPIFIDSSTASAYLNNDGAVTIKDALNYYDDISPAVFDLEIPQNLKAVQIAGDTSISDSIKSSLDLSDKIEIPKYSFQWEQTDPAYKDWTTEVYIYSDIRYRDATLYFIMDDWQYVDDYYMLEDTVQTYKLCWNVNMKKYAQALGNMEDDYPTSFGGEYEIDMTTFYFRNRYSDDGVRHYSNWVVVEYDVTTGEIISSHIEVEGSDVDLDSDGKVVKPSGSIVEDSQYNGVDYDGLEQRASTDIVGFIEDGFGFLGNGGVIDLISEVFSFIPSPIWAVFITGISLFVLVALVKVVF